MLMASGVVLIPVPCMFLLNPILMNWSHGNERQVRAPVSLMEPMKIAKRTNKARIRHNRA